MVPARSIILVLLAVFTLAVFAAQPTAAQRATGRVALVIGNQDYSSLPTLKNPEADAALMESVLGGVGFDVVTVKNAGRSAIVKALIEFRKKITAGSVAFIYYSGHGLQSSGENYLIPVDAELTDALDLPLAAVSAREVLSHIESTDAGAIIFVLDACRDNPFGQADGKTRSIANEKAISRGLARIASTHTGTMIAFSTAPGAVALDGRGANSPYTEALASAIKTPGNSIEAVFKQTRAKVVELTKGRQIPWENSSLVNEVVLIPEEGKPDIVVATPCDLAAAHPSDPQRVGPSVEFANLDPQTAIPACEEAVRADPANMRFKVLLARALDKAGRGKEAFELNKVAMAGGYLGAYHNMGNLYRKGLGVEKDLKKAFDHYLYAAERGHPEDQNNIGYMYYRGSGVKKDYQLARKWFEKAAAQNWGTSYDKLGLIFLNGHGTGKDLDKAIALFRQGADLGDRNSMTNLANLYKDGAGVEQDYQEARDLYLRAARLGGRAAFVNLGLIYADGLGTGKDLVEAAFWYTLASREGHEFAQEQLTSIRKQLDDGDLEELQRRLDDWTSLRFG